MLFRSMLCSAVWVVCAASAQAQQSSAPASRASAAAESPASAASSTGRAAGRPLAATPAEAAVNAQMPGKFRPENPVMPQIVIPLRTDKDAGGLKLKSANLGGAGDGINDRVARCAAQKTTEERRACRLANPAARAP